MEKRPCLPPASRAALFSTWQPLLSCVCNVPNANPTPHVGTVQNQPPQSVEITLRGCQELRSEQTSDPNKAVVVGAGEGSNASTQKSRYNPSADTSESFRRKKLLKNRVRQRRLGFVQLHTSRSLFVLWDCFFLLKINSSCWNTPRTSDVRCLQRERLRWELPTWVLQIQFHNSKENGSPHAFLSPQGVQIKSAVSCLHRQLGARLRYLPTLCHRSVPW